MLYITEFNKKVKTINQLMRWLKRNKGIKYIVNNKSHDYMAVRKLIKIRGNSFAGSYENKAENSQNEVWTILHLKDEVYFTSNGFTLVTKDGGTTDYKFFKETKVNNEYQELNSISTSDSIECYIEGKKITGDMFIKLCKEYNVKIASQTLYWIRRCLLTIKYSDNHCVCECKYTYESKSIDKIARELYEKLIAEA